MVAANQAAQAQKGAANAAIQANKDALNQAETLTQPQRDLGRGAMGKLGNLFGINPDGSPSGAAPDYSGFNNSPGFKFGLDLAQGAVNKNAAAQGNLYSPTTMGKMAETTTGFASQHYQDYVKNLMDMAGLGAKSSDINSGQAVTTGENIAQGQTNIGTANANNALSQGAAFSGLLSNKDFTSALGNLLGGNNRSGVQGTGGMADMTSRANPIMNVVSPY